MKKQLTKNIMKIIIAVLVIIVTAIIYVVYEVFTKKEPTYAATVQDEKNYEIIDKVEINLEEILQNNISETKKEEIIKEEVDIEYTTKYTDNPNLPRGMIQVIQEGVDGKQEIITKKVYEGETLIKEEQVGSQIISSSINKMVQVGTGSYRRSYNVQVGDTIYVTALFLAIRIEPNESANKLITLEQNTEVKLIKKQDEWYRIQYESYIGWAKGENFTYLKPNEQKVEEEEEIVANGQYTKQQLLNTLSFDMKLNKPSGLSLEQFKKIFENEEKDTKKIFKNNAQYFYYAEKQYNVNGVFIAAVAIHESGWGGSAIASDKNNLFGYGAFDRDPYNSAYEFSEYSEGIDLLARVFAKYYLNPAGTEIYDGNIADGAHYNGPTLSGVNVKYATDKNWANGVYYWMKYLYNNL